MRRPSAEIWLSAESCRGGGLSGNLATAKADSRSANKQLPVRDGRQDLAVVSLKDPGSGGMTEVTPRIQPFGSTAAVQNFGTATRVMVTVAGGRLNVVYAWFVGGFGAIVAKSCIRLAFRVFTHLSGIRGFDLKVGDSEWGTPLEFLGATINSSFAQGNRGAEVSLCATLFHKLLGRYARCLANPERFSPRCKH